jgi:hypothetical protein
MAFKPDIKTQEEKINMSHIIEDEKETIKTTERIIIPKRPQTAVRKQLLSIDDTFKCNLREAGIHFTPTKQNNPHHGIYATCMNKQQTEVKEV